MVTPMEQQSYRDKMLALGELLHASTSEDVQNAYFSSVDLLTSEEGDETSKITLLLQLQDHLHLHQLSSTLITSLIGCLKGQLSNNRHSNLYKSQVLVSLVTIMLSQEEYVEDSVFEIMIRDIKQNLLTDVLGMKVKKPVLLRTTSCECLKEIERHYPGILIPDIEDIWRACESPKNRGFESLPSLLSLVLNDLMDALKKPSNISQVTDSFLKECDISDLTTVLQEHEIMDMVMFLLDASTHMPSISAYDTLHSLMNIISYSPSLSPSIFKYWIPKLSLSSEVPLFHLAISMQMQYLSALYTEQEEEALYNHLKICCQHSSLTAAQRLLYLEWAEHLIENILPLQRPGELSPFFPSPFDGPDMQEKKLRLLVACVQRSASQKNVFLDLTKIALNNMQEKILYTKRGRSTSAFFRSFYCVFINTSDVFSSHSYLVRSLCSLVASAPWLMHHILNFVDCIRKDMQHCELAQEIFVPLVEQVLGLSCEDAKVHISYYMLLLKKALESSPETCKLENILKFIRVVLERTDVCESGNWIIGNSIISTCKSFFHHPNLEAFYSEYAELLWYMVTEFQDIDVASRAKMLYAALASLSLPRVQELFKGPKALTSTEKSAFITIASDDSNMCFEHCIRTIKSSPIQLSRILQHADPSSDQEFSKNSSCSQIPEFHLKQDNLDDYLQHLCSDNFKAVIKRSYKVSLQKSEDACFQQLYGIVISFSGKPWCKDVPGEHEVSVEIEPLEPRHFTLAIRAVFSTKDGVTYSCNLPLEHVDFEDLFLPLPHPPSCQSWPADTLKQQLFSQMWMHISNKSRQGVNNYQESVYRTSMGKRDLSLFSQRWSKFLISLTDVDIKDQLQVAIFLPPKYHLLMHMKIIDEAITVFLVTDNYNVLAFVDMLFHTENEGEFARA